MFHKAFVGLALMVGLWAAARMTSLGSYAGTLWSQARAETKRHISTRFEIERARHELDQLDKDIAAMIRPIAEYKAALQQLDKDFRQGQTNLGERRDALMRLTLDLEQSAPTVVIGSRTVSADKARSILERDFSGFERLEKHVESLGKLREAKQSSLEAAQEQLAKILSKKREFAVRLAQLETDEETLKIASLGNKMAVDENRTSAIEATLADIEQRQNIRRAELELASGDLISDLPTSSSRPRLDLASIKSHLQRVARD